MLSEHINQQYIFVETWSCEVTLQSIIMILIWNLNFDIYVSVLSCTFLLYICSLDRTPPEFHARKSGDYSDVDNYVIDQ